MEKKFYQFIDITARHECCFIDLSVQFARSSLNKKGFIDNWRDEQGRLRDLNTY
jgi:hypothetical protein